MKESQLLKESWRAVCWRLFPKAIYGYELIQSLKEMGFDKIVAGTIYPSLQKLEKQGIIHGEWGRLQMVPIVSIFTHDAGKERLGGEFGDQWRELVTKVERIKKEEKNGRKLYRKMSDELIHLKKEDQAYVKKNGRLYWG